MIDTLDKEKPSRRFAARQQREQFMAGLPVGLWSANINKKGESSDWHCSSFLREIAGRPSDSEIETPERWLEIVHPEDRSRVEAIRSRLQRGESVPENHQYRIVLPDGSARWVDERLQARDKRNGTVLINGVVTDITETKSAQEERQQLAAIVESCDDAVLSKTLDGVVTNWNSGAERMYGYSSQEVIGRAVSFLFPSDRLNELTHILKAIQRGDRIEHYDTERLCKDRTRIPVSVTVSPVRNHAGLIVGASAIARDITRQKKADTELRASMAALQESRRKMQALTARLISVQESNNRILARELHDDLSQRVAALALDIKRLADHPPDSPDGLRNALRQTSELIGKTAADIHQLSRQLHPAILEDLGLPAALKAECSAFVERHSVPCEFVAHNLPHKIPEDISLCIYRVAQEALRNVGKHAGAQTVEVRLIGTEKAIDLSIIDEGDGFDLEKVRSSTGLGLVSMEERTRIVGGQFSITSQEGKGTLVRVSIPV